MLIYGQELVQMCDEAGVLLEFLPPYSPDKNPIELWFGVFKKWLRTNRKLQEDHESLESFIEAAIEANREGEHAQGHIRHSGYRYI
jgi:transposase